MVSENLAQVRKRIDEAAKRAGRSPDSVKLVCVTKAATVSQVREALKQGAADIGENRVQDALLKYSQLGSEAKSLKWHMIGHLQTNKVKKALEIFDVIHSVDSLKLCEEINKQAAISDRKIDCLVEVKTTTEPSKYGIDQYGAADLIRKAALFSNIRIIGLMTMAPLSGEPEKARPYFSKLREISRSIEALNIENVHMKELSMGMTQDFEIAIEEGATIIRVGTAIFKE